MCNFANNARFNPSNLFTARLSDSSLKKPGKSPPFFSKNKDSLREVTNTDDYYGSAQNRPQ